MAATGRERIAAMVLKYEVKDQAVVSKSIQAVRVEAKSLNDDFAKLGPITQANVTAAQNRMAALKTDIKVANNDTNKFNDTFGKVNTRLEELARQKAIKQIADDFAKAAKNGGDLNAALQTTVERLTAVNASDIEINKVVDIGASTGGAQRGGLGQLGSQIRQLPSVQIPGLGIGTDSVGSVLRVADAVSRGAEGMAVSLAPIGPIALAVGAALVPIAIGLGEYTKQLERNAEAIRIRIKAEVDFARATQDATTAELRAAQAEAKKNLDFETEQLEKLGSASLEALRPLSALQISLLSAGVALDDQAIAYREATRASDEQLVAFENAKATYKAATAALEENKGAANDARAAGEALSQSWIDFIQKALDARQTLLRSEAEDARNDFLEVSRAANGTAQQARERVKSLNDESTALAAAIEVLRDSGDTEQLEKYSEQIRENDNDVRTLTTSIIPMLDAREKEIAQYKLLTETMPAAGAKVRDAMVKVQEAEAKLADEYALNAANVTKIADVRAAAEAKAFTNLSKAEDEARQKRHDALEKQEQSHQDKLQSIVRKANRVFANAIASRDALAFYLGAQQKKDELAEEKVNNRRRKQEIAKAYRDELSLAHTRYRDELTMAKQTAEASLKLEAARHSKQLELQGIALTAMINQYRQYLSVLQALGAQTGRQVVIPTSTTLTTEQARAQGFLPRAIGGKFAANQKLLVGEQGPELVSFNRPGYVHNAAETRTASGGGGMSFNVAVNGYMGEREFVTKATRVFHSELTRTIKAARRGKAG